MWYYFCYFIKNSYILFLKIFQKYMTSHDVQNFTKGNIIPQIWSIAWPIMLTIFFYTMYNIVDTFWVSKVWDEAIAAVSISQVAQMVMMSLSMWVSIGSSVLISMHIGWKNKSEAARVMAQSFLLAAILGIFFTIISLIFREPILTASGAVWAIYQPALDYFTIVSAGWMLLFFLINIMMMFNAEWDTFTVTKLFAISTVVNIVLDPILIFGAFWFPALWVAGAAYATLVSQTIFIIIAMRVLSSKKRKIFFEWKNLSIEKQSVKKVLDIWIPAAFTQVINPVGLAILIYIVSAKFLEPGATAFSLAFRLEFFAYLPAVWFGMAAMSLIGQNMWAGNFQRAQEVFKKSILLSFVSALWLWIILIIFGKYLINIFSTDPTVVQYTLSYLWIVALTYWAMAISMVVANSFQATGKSWPGFWLMVIKFFIVAIPLWYLSIHYFNLPIWWVWWALATSNIIVAIIWYIWNKNNFKKLQKTL